MSGSKKIAQDLGESTPNAVLVEKMLTSLARSGYKNEQIMTFCRAATGCFAGEGKTKRDVVCSQLWRIRTKILEGDFKNMGIDKVLGRKKEKKPKKTHKEESSGPSESE